MRLKKEIALLNPGPRWSVLYGLRKIWVNGNLPNVGHGDGDGLRAAYFPRSRSTR